MRLLSSYGRTSESIGTLLLRSFPRRWQSKLATFSGVAVLTAAAVWWYVEQRKSQQKPLGQPAEQALKLDSRARKNQKPPGQRAEQALQLDSMERRRQASLDRHYEDELRKDQNHLQADLVSQMQQDLSDLAISPDSNVFDSDAQEFLSLSRDILDALEPILREFSCKQIPFWPSLIAVADAVLSLRRGICKEHNTDAMRQSRWWQVLKAHWPPGSDDVTDGDTAWVLTAGRKDDLKTVMDDDETFEHLENSMRDMYPYTNSAVSKMGLWPRFLTPFTERFSTSRIGKNCVWMD